MLMGRVQGISKGYDGREAGKLAIRQKVDERSAWRYSGGLREEIEMKTYLHGPMDYAK